jgi:hypothetical protein
VRQRFSELGLDVPPRNQQTPEALAAYYKAEIEKWWPLINAANIKVNYQQFPPPMWLRCK